MAIVGDGRIYLRRWLEMVGMVGDVGTLLGWLEMLGDGCVGIVVDSWRCLEMVGGSWRWLDLVGE